MSSQRNKKYNPWRYDRNATTAQTALLSLLIDPYSLDLLRYRNCLRASIFGFLHGVTPFTHARMIIWIKTLHRLTFSLRKNKAVRINGFAPDRICELISVIFAEAKIYENCLVEGSSHIEVSQYTADLFVSFIDFANAILESQSIALIELTFLHQWKIFDELLLSAMRGFDASIVALSKGVMAGYTARQAFAKLRKYDRDFLLNKIVASDTDIKEYYEPKVLKFVSLVHMIVRDCTIPYPVDIHAVRKFGMKYLSQIDLSADQFCQKILPTESVV